MDVPRTTIEQNRRDAQYCPLWPYGGVSGLGQNARTTGGAGILPAAILRKVRLGRPKWRLRSRAECPDHRWRGHSARRHSSQSPAREAKVNSIGRDARSTTQPGRLCSFFALTHTPAGYKWVSLAVRPYLASSSANPRPNAAVGQRSSRIRTLAAPIARRASSLISAILPRQAVISATFAGSPPPAIHALIHQLLCCADISAGEHRQAAGHCLVDHEAPRFLHRRMNKCPGMSIKPWQIINLPKTGKEDGSRSQGTGVRGQERFPRRGLDDLEPKFMAFGDQLFP